MLLYIYPILPWFGAKANEIWNLAPNLNLCLSLACFRQFFPQCIPFFLNEMIHIYLVCSRKKNLQAKLANSTWRLIIGKSYMGSRILTLVWFCFALNRKCMVQSVKRVVFYVFNLQGFFNSKKIEFSNGHSEIKT